MVAAVGEKKGWTQMDTEKIRSKLMRQDVWGTRGMLALPHGLTLPRLDAGHSNSQPGGHTNKEQS